MNTDGFVAMRLLGETLEYARHLTNASLCITQYPPMFNNLIPLEIQTKNRFHYTPFCRTCQRIQDKQLCNKVHYDEIYRLCLEKRHAFINRCYAGVTEAVIPVFYKGGMAAIILLSGLRTGNFYTDHVQHDLDGLFSKAGIDMEKAAITYQHMPVISHQQLADVMNLTCNCISAIMKVYELMATNTGSNANRYVTNASAFISGNTSDPQLSACTVAQKMNITREYLSKLFRKGLGITIQDYILNTRMERACLLLSNTTMPLREIAQSTGYPDQNYFSRVFKNKFKMTPTRYRQLSAKETADI